jgi:anti-sigma regulatory factor (Ser/Thr protein kinase)
VATVEDLAKQWAIAPKLAMQLNLVLEELFSNIVFYGFADGQAAAAHRTTFDFTRGAGVLTIVVTDSGRPFNLLEDAEAPNLHDPLEQRHAGGLGVHFVKKSMDAVEYAREDGKNVVTLTKKY